MAQRDSAVLILGSENRASDDPEAGPRLDKPVTQPAIRTAPSDKWTTHQLFYVFFLHGFGAMVLSGGINFAIAYGE